VHRALVGSLGLGEGGITPDEEAVLDDDRRRRSRPERRAMAAERDTVDRLIAAFLAEQVDSTFAARISGVTKSGLFVQLPQYGADGFIPISSLGDDYYHFDEAARSLFGERSGKGFQLADRVEVRLVEVTPLAGAMRFEMLSEPKPLPGSKRSFHKSKGARNKQSYGARTRASQPRARSRK
jgi:ribonuclease R